MGCFQSRTDETDQIVTPPQPPKQVYSWDRTERPDPKDITFEDLEEAVVGKLPGSLKGKAFVIRNCKSTRIYLFDFTAAVSVDDCENCELVIGPVKGSVFVRDCVGCRVLVATHQFRMRDCRKMELHLHVSSQPVIENCVGIKFGCFQGNYKGIAQQMKEAGLSCFINNWSVIHDFTPVPETENWTLIPPDIKPSIELPEKEGKFSEATFTFESNRLPLTMGSIKQRLEGFFPCLIAFAANVDTDKILDFIQTSQSNKVVLIQTMELKLTEDQSSQLFSSKKVSKELKSSAQQVGVILLEYNLSSADLFQSLQLAARNDSNPIDSAVTFMSRDHEQGERDIETLDNIISHKMVS